MTDPVVETPLAVGALGIVRRFVNAGKDDLTFQIAVDSTADRETIFQVMDTISAVAAREQLKSDLAEKRKALKVAQTQPAEMEKEIERMRVGRLAYLAARDALRPGRRLPPEENKKQVADLAKFDEQIEQAALARKNFMRDLPIIEWEIACLVARINGDDEPPKPPELEAALAELSLAA